MALQRIIRMCPYALKNEDQDLCPDYKVNIIYKKRGLFQRSPNHYRCLYVAGGSYFCKHTDPSELLGYNLNDKDIEEYIKEKKRAKRGSGITG